MLSNNTALIKITLDTEGCPCVDAELITVNEGDRIVFIGPEEFEIIFPEGTPFCSERINTTNAVISERVQANANAKLRNANSYCEFKYEVVVGDKVLDPKIRVRR